MADRRRRYMLLDGMRGLAAIAVVLHHFGERSDLPWLFPRPYLVDFFFVLSGFVLADAYGGRLRASLTPSAFVVRRLIRLLPVLVPGSVFGVVIEYWRPHAGDPLAHMMAAVGAGLLGCLLIPWPFLSSMEDTIFPINGPFWSLFFELLANFVFIAVARAACPRAVAWKIVAVSAVAMIGCDLAYAGFNLGPLVSNWPGGAPRMFFAFFAGVIVHANRHRFPTVGAWPLTVMLVVLFALPSCAPTADMVIDIAVVAIVLPVFVGVASGSRVAPRFVPPCRLLADLSYPLYAIHYPILRVICFVVDRHALPAAARLGIAVVSVVGIMALSWAVLVFYDQPARQFLTRRLGSGSRAHDAPSRQPTHAA